MNGTQLPHGRHGIEDSDPTAFDRRPRAGGLVTVSGAKEKRAAPVADSLLTASVSFLDMIPTAVDAQVHVGCGSAGQPVS